MASSGEFYPQIQWPGNKSYWCGLGHDCGHEGGVNRDDSETEYQPGASSDEPETDAENSNDELEWNPLQQCKLLAEVATLTKPTADSNSNSTHNWAKAEKNWSLGYNGQSECSKQWKEKAACDQKEYQKQAQMSWAFTILDYWALQLTSELIPKFW